MNSSSESIVGGGLLALVSGVVGRAASATSLALLCFLLWGKQSGISLTFLFRV